MEGAGTRASSIMVRAVTTSEGGFDTYCRFSCVMEGSDLFGQCRLLLEAG